MVVEMLKFEKYMRLAATTSPATSIDYRPGNQAFAVPNSGRGRTMRQDIKKNRRIDSVC
jgi:hypothetical protein